MNSFQKVIKYLGMAFAMVLTVSIIGGICAAVFGVSVSIGGKETVEAVSEDYELKAFESLDIDAGIASVNIQKGDKYYVETVDVPDTLKVEVKGDKLLIKNKNKMGWKNVFNKDTWSKKSKITVTVPSDFVGDKVKIDGGVGNVTITDLTMDVLELDGGVGDFTGEELKGKKISVEAGVGNVILNDIAFEDCKVDCGVGNIELEGRITGECKIDGGVGNCDLRLEGSRKDYDIDIDGGAGSVRINGEKVRNIEEKNDGSSKLEVEGGVGNIDIEFTED